MADVAILFGLALLALLVFGALSPLEALGWWAGWFGEPVTAKELDPHPWHADDPEDDAGAPGGDPTPDHGPWVVFLTGINAVGGVVYAERERRLLERLRAALPDGHVVQVFPYSVTNRALTGQRAFAWLWRWALARKLGPTRLDGAAGFLINLRNLWQVLVSADRRYGPLYNRGSAALMLRALKRRGYTGGGRLVLVGLSGGGQVAAGAAPFVKEVSGAEVVVVPLGGVVAADRGLLDADRVVSLVGAQDHVRRAWARAFPGRWRLLRWSPWNVARRRGTLAEVTLGPCDHTGEGGYLDDVAHAADGRSYLQVTIDVLAAIARDVPTADLPVAALTA